MSMLRKDSIHVAGSVSAAGAAVAPPANEGARRWTVAAPVGSVYTITLDEPIDPTERVIHVSPRGTVNNTAVHLAAGDTDTVFTVGTQSAPAMAADVAFDFVVLRVAG